jgi:DNA-binding XRE family transcriptional regulator
MEQTRHCLAFLRKLLGLTQAEMASLVGCATVTIKAVELGKLKLSFKLAERISAKTGIHIHWLQNNDLKAPLTDDRGSPYSIDTFEKRRAEGVRSWDLPHGDLDHLEKERRVVTLHDVG